MNDLSYINQLFKEYRENQYLAVRECGINESISCNKKIEKIAIQYTEMTVGGVQRVISLLIPMYLEMGHQVIVIIEKLDEKLDYKLPEGVPVYIVPKEQECLEKKSIEERSHRLQEIIHKENVDMVCYHNAASSLLWYDYLVYREEQVPFILTKHEYMLHDLYTMHDCLLLHKLVLPLFNKVIVLSETEKAFWNCLDIETQCIPNPIDNCVTEGERKDNNNILWIGRLEQCYKQCLHVVDIMKRVVKEIPTACLKIYGNEFEAGILDKLLATIKENNLEENITYCGYVTENISQVYEDVSVHLVTSVCESFSMTIFESRLNALPLVLYRMPYLQLLKERKGYIEVENDDTEGAARAIIAILRDGSLRKKLSDEALESIQDFNNESVKTQWINVFESIAFNQKKTLGRASTELKNALDSLPYLHHKGIERIAEQRKEIAKGNLKEKLMLVLHFNKLPIVIYPFGVVGRMVKTILNEELGIKEAFIVDNKLQAEEYDIKKVSDLKNMDCSRYCFLICSSSKAQSRDIRESLLELVRKENVVDLFPLSDE